MPVKKVFNLYKYDNTIAHENVLEMNDFEYGSNSNGQYWKFANGLMICKNTVWKQYEAKTAGYIGYVVFNNFWSFPQPFIDNPFIYASARQGGTQAWIGNYVSSVSDVTSIMFYTQQALSGAATNFDCVAIGRWK